MLLKDRSRFWLGWRVVWGLAIGILLLKKVFKKPPSTIINSDQNWKPETKLLTYSKATQNFSQSWPGIGSF